MKKNYPRIHEYPTRLADRNDTSESELSDGQGSWLSHAYGASAASATAAAVAAVTAPRPPPRNLSAAAAAPAGECWVRRSTRMQTRLISPTATRTFRSEGIDVRGLGEGDAGLWDRAPCTCFADPAGGSPVRTAEGRRVSCVSPEAPAAASAAAAAVAASAVPRADVFKLHYEAEFVQLVRGQIERFDSSYKQWRTEMMEAKTVKSNTFRNVATTTNEGTGILPSATTMTLTETTSPRRVSRDHETPSHDFPQHQDPRSQIWQCNSEVEYYEKYSHVINNENPHDLCSCYHTYEGSWGNHEKSWSGMDNIPPYSHSPLKHKKLSHISQDIGLLPQPIEINEIDCSNWVYINPYICELPVLDQVCASQKTQEISSFPCCGGHQELVNNPTKEEINSQTQDKKWYQMPEDRLEENKKGNIEDKEKSNDENDDDVQSQMDSYLEWRNEKSSDSSCITHITPQIKDNLNTANESNENLINTSDEEPCTQKNQKTSPGGTIGGIDCSKSHDTFLHLQPVKNESVENLKSEDYKQSVLENSQSLNLHDHNSEAAKETTLLKSDLEIEKLKEKHLPSTVQSIQNIDWKVKLEDIFRTKENYKSEKRERNYPTHSTERVNPLIPLCRQYINIKGQHQYVRFKNILPCDPQQKNKYPAHGKKSCFMQTEKEFFHTPQGPKLNEVEKSDTYKNVTNHIKANDLFQSSSKRKKTEESLRVTKQGTKRGQVNSPFPSYYNYKDKKPVGLEVRKNKTLDTESSKPKLANATMNKNKNQNYLLMGKQFERNVNISRNLSGTVHRAKANQRYNSPTYEPAPIWEYRESPDANNFHGIEHRINFAVKKLTLASVEHEKHEKEHRIIPTKQKKKHLCRMPSKRLKKVEPTYSHLGKNTSTDQDSSTPHRKTHIKGYFRKKPEYNVKAKSREMHYPKQNKRKVLKVIWFRKKRNLFNESEDYPSSSKSESEENESPIRVNSNSSVNSTQNNLSQESELKLPFKKNSQMICNGPHELNYVTRKPDIICRPVMKNGQVDDIFHCSRLKENLYLPTIISMSTNDSELSSKTEETRKENSEVLTENLLEDKAVNALPRNSTKGAPELMIQATVKNSREEEKSVELHCVNISHFTSNKISNNIYNSHQRVDLLPEKMNDMIQKDNSEETAPILKEMPFYTGSISVHTPLQQHSITSIGSPITNASLTSNYIDSTQKKKYESSEHLQKEKNDPCDVIYPPVISSKGVYLSECTLLEKVSLFPADSEQPVEKESWLIDYENNIQTNNLQSNENKMNCQEIITTNNSEIVSNNRNQKFKGTNSGSNEDIIIINKDYSLQGQHDLTLSQQCANREKGKKISRLTEYFVQELQNSNDIDATSTIHSNTQPEKNSENINFETETINDIYLNKIVFFSPTNKKQYISNKQKNKSLVEGTAILNSNETNLVYDKSHSTGANTSQEDALRPNYLESNDTNQNIKRELDILPLSTEFKLVEEDTESNKKDLQQTKIQHFLNENINEHKEKIEEIALQTNISSRGKFYKNIVENNVQKISVDKIFSVVRKENIFEKKRQQTELPGIFQNQLAKSKPIIDVSSKKEIQSLFYPRLYTKSNTKCKIKHFKKIRKNKSTQTKKTILRKCISKPVHSTASIYRRELRTNNSPQNRSTKQFIIASTFEDNIKDEAHHNDVILPKKVDNELSKKMTEEKFVTSDNLYTMHTIQKWADSSLLTQYPNGSKQEDRIPCETKTINSSTQTDQYFLTTESNKNKIDIVETSFLDNEKQYVSWLQNKLCGEKLKKYNPMQNQHAIKSLLIQTAKDILQNDVFKLVFMQNYITVEDIPLSKMNTLKEAAKVLLTKNLNTDIFTQDRLINYHAGDDETIRKIKLEYFSQDKITALKKVTKILLEQLSMAHAIPKTEYLMTHISEARDKIKYAAQIILNNKNPLLIPKNSNIFHSESGKSMHTNKDIMLHNLKSKTNKKTEMRNALTHLKQRILKHKHTKNKRNICQILKTKLILEQMGLIVKDVFETKPQMLPSENFMIHFKLRKINFNESMIHSHSSVNEKGDAKIEKIIELTYPIFLPNTTEKSAHNLKRENSSKISELKRIPSYLYSYNGGDYNKNYFHQNFVFFNFPHFQKFSTQTPSKQNTYSDFSSCPSSSQNDTKIINTKERIQLLSSATDGINIDMPNMEQNSSNMKIPFNSFNNSIRMNRQKHNSEPVLYYYKLHSNSVETNSWDSMQFANSERVPRNTKELRSNCNKGQECGGIIPTNDLNKSPTSSVYSVRSFISESSHVSVMDEEGNLKNSSFKTGNINYIPLITSSQWPKPNETCSTISNQNFQHKSVNKVPKSTQTTLSSDLKYSMGTQFHVSNKTSHTFSNQPHIIPTLNTFRTQLPTFNPPMHCLFQSSKNIDVENLKKVTIFSLNKPPENTYDPNINYVNDININVAKGLKSIFYTQSLPPIEIQEPCVICISELEPKVPHQTWYTPYYVPPTSQMYVPQPLPIQQSKKKLYKMNCYQWKLRVNKRNSIQKYKTEIKKYQKKMIKHVPHNLQYILSFCCCSNQYTQQKLQEKEKYINKYTKRNKFHSDKTNYAKQERLMYTSMEQTHPVNMNERRTIFETRDLWSPFSLEVPDLLRAVTQNCLCITNEIQTDISQISLNKMTSFHLKSISFWRKIICLTSILTLPLLMYTGSILSLALCKSQTCSNNWPSLWHVNSHSQDTVYNIIL